MKIDPSKVNRTIRILIESGEAAGIEEAEAILRRYKLQILVTREAAQHECWQAAALTGVNAATRAMLGGVDVQIEQDAVANTPWAAGELLSHAIIALGGSVVDELDPDFPTLVIGAPEPQQRPAAGSPAIHICASGWRAGVRPVPLPIPGPAPSVTAAVTAAGIGVSEAFQRLRGSKVAGSREVGLSLWDPGRDWRTADRTEPVAPYLPAAAWLIGLGHLGQAYAWHIGCLPYGDHSEISLYLQDDDAICEANRGTSLLLAGQADGTRKARLVAERLDALGFTTHIIERKFGPDLRVQPGEPKLALVGLDNPSARRPLSGAGFDLVVDAGLGATPADFTDMSIHELPGPRTSDEIWRRNTETMTIDDAHPTYDAIATQTDDRCGVQLMLGTSVATAFVGVVAAGLGIAAALRHIHDQPPVPFVSYSLRSIDPPQADVDTGHPAARIASVPAR